jgi:hypothetical protein
MNIFVCYTTRNNEVTANSLIDFSNKINSYGNVFVDLLDNDSNDKQKRIINELKKSNLLILIKSESSLNSEWVKFELETADKLNIPVIEFLIDDLYNLTQEKIGQVINNHFNK